MLSKSQSALKCFNNYEECKTILLRYSVILNSQNNFKITKNDS